MGLAFEVHDSVSRAKKMENLPKKKDTVIDSQEYVDLESEIRFKSIITPSAEDIFHYAFCHAGILTGIAMFERNVNYITRYFNWFISIWSKGISFSTFILQGHIIALEHGKICTIILGVVGQILEVPF